MNKTRIITIALSFSLAAGAIAHAQDDRGRGRGRGRGQQPNQPHQLSPDEQRQRAQQEEQRAAAYKQHLDEQVRAMQQQSAQLQQQKRTAQYQAQQRYAAQLAQQQQRLQAARDYSNDPYVRTPATYQYRLNGTTRQTNQYGADVLRQAVNDGYQQGVAAGAADRQDHWKSNYSASPAYRDANYGYTGNYVDQTDYNYYFRQGFRKGYDDGYNRRTQYGTTANGSTSILGNILSSILGLTTIH
jgi:hypothetical protein